MVKQSGVRQQPDQNHEIYYCFQERK